MVNKFQQEVWNLRESETEAQKNLKILIVEDEVLIAEDIKISLGRIGYVVTDVVATGEKALESIAGNRPDVVLMDITLKGKLSGIDVAREINLSWKIPVIFTTSSEDKKTISLAKESEPAGYLIKPIDMRELRATIEIAVYKSKMQKALAREKERAELLNYIVPSAVITIDLNYKVTGWNRQAALITGYQAHEVMGKSCELFCNETCRDGCSIFDPNIEKPIFKEECVLKKKSGDRIIVSKNAEVIRDDKAQVIGGIESFEDITIQKAAESRLKNAHNLLEKKVRERTLELEEANTLLKKEIISHKATEKALLYTKTRLEEAQQMAHLGHWEWKITDNTIVWSREVYRIFGVNPEKFKPTYDAFLAMIPPEDKTALVDSVNSALKKKTPYRIRHGIVRPDGSHRMVQEKGKLEFDTAGTPVKMIGTVLDITAQQRVENQIQQKISELSTMNDMTRAATANLDVNSVLESIYHHIFASIDPDLIVIYLLEKNILSHFGEKLKKTVRNFNAPKSKKIGECLCGAVTLKMKPVFSMDIHSDPRCTLNECKEAGMTSFAGLPLVAGQNKVGVLGIGSVARRDFSKNKDFLITLSLQIGIILRNTMLHSNVQLQIKKLQEAIEKIRAGEIQIKQSKNLLQSVVDGIGDPMILLNNDLQIKLLNKPAIQYLETSFEEAVNKKTLTAIFKEKGYMVSLDTKALFRRNHPYSFETAGWINPDQIEKIHIYPITTSEEAYFILRIRDITEEKKIEKQMYQNDKLTALGQLSAGVAHEINNPIMGIINYAQIMIDDNKSDDSDTEIPKRIIKEGKRIATIVKSLLSFARANPEEHSQVSIEPILNDIKSLVVTQIRQNKIEFDIRIQKALPDFFGNSQQLQQVFLNLITNSIYALEKKNMLPGEAKKLCIECDLHEHSVKPMIRIKVSDNGIGIPDHIIGKVYDPFFTTKPADRGTGLGLSISHGIIKNHDGEIKIESQKNRYTCVTVLLPVMK